MTAAASLALLALLLQTTPGRDATPPLVDDVRRLSAAATNEARFDALTALLRGKGLTFSVETFSIDKPLGREPRTEGRNVVVTLGDGPQDVVIGAHYDAARLPDGSLSRGAVDNAASSVILVRLAEALRSEALPVRLRIVWFDMEELGLIGSSRYVTLHAGDRIKAMLNFDINGYGNTIIFGPDRQAANAAVRRALVQTCAAEDVPCVGFAQLPPGDDRSFIKAGVPTISVAILPALEAHQLWLMMNAGPGAGLAPDAAPAIMRTIHTPEDREEKVSEETMARMTRFALSLVRAVARP